MRLDVLIPTFNRADQLARALDTLLAAPNPPAMSVSITVIDNNCTDNTRAVVESRIGRSRHRLCHVSEVRQGRSHALNRGIATTNGELVAMLDDDEEIDATWYASIAEAFADPTVDFVGGPYVPRWSVSKPAWLPSECGGVVGWVDGGDSVALYDDSFQGMLMGGNAVIRRSVIDRVGPYATWLGHTGDRLLSGEDRDFYVRLRAAGARGFYLPHLVIYHHIPAERCTKRYFRRWMFWHGVSLGLIERRSPTHGARLFGIPRWHTRRAGRGVLAALASVFVDPSKPAEAFAQELAAYEWSGLLYGRHLFQRAAVRRDQADGVNLQALAS